MIAKELGDEQPWAGDETNVRNVKEILNFCRSKKKPWLDGYTPFIMVSLSAINYKTALTKINQNIFLFLNISGEIRTFAFNPNGDLKSNPNWEQMFAENKGVLTGVNKELVVGRLCSEPQNLKIESIKAKIVAQLRYEYALNLLQRLGVSLTRIGLDFRNILKEGKKSENGDG